MIGHFVAVFQVTSWCMYVQMTLFSCRFVPAGKALIERSRLSFCLSLIANWFLISLCYWVNDAFMIENMVCLAIFTCHHIAIPRMTAIVKHDDDVISWHTHGVAYSPWHENGMVVMIFQPSCERQKSNGMEFPCSMVPCVSLGWMQDGCNEITDILSYCPWLVQPIKELHVIWKTKFLCLCTTVNEIWRKLMRFWIPWVSTDVTLLVKWDY